MILEYASTPIEKIHSASEEVLGGRINGTLTIAVEQSRCDPLLEPLHHVVDSDQLDDTLMLLPLHEPERDRNMMPKRPSC